MKHLSTILISSICTAILMLIMQFALNQVINYQTKLTVEARTRGYKEGKAEGLVVARIALEKLHKADLENATKIWVLSEGSVAQRYYEYIRDFNIDNLLNN